MILEIMKANADTLVHFAMNRVQLTNEFVRELCDDFSAMSKLEKFEFRMPEEAERLDYFEAFKAIAKMANGKPKPIEVIISNYHGKYLMDDLQVYLEVE